MTGRGKPIEYSRKRWNAEVFLGTLAQDIPVLVCGSWIQFVDDVDRGITRSPTKLGICASFKTRLYSSQEIKLGIRKLSYVVVEYPVDTINGYETVLAKIPDSYPVYNF